MQVRRFECSEQRKVDSSAYHCQCTGLNDIDNQIVDQSARGCPGVTRLCHIQLGTWSDNI